MRGMEEWGGVRWGRVARARKGSADKTRDGSWNRNSRSKRPGRRRAGSMWSRRFCKLTMASGNMRGNMRGVATAGTRERWEWQEELERCGVGSRGAGHSRSLQSRQLRPGHQVHPSGRAARTQWSCSSGPGGCCARNQGHIKWFTFYAAALFIWRQLSRLRTRASTTTEEIYALGTDLPPCAAPFAAAASAHVHKLSKSAA